MSDSTFAADRKAEAGIARQATWKGRIWDTFDLPKDERQLLLRVDAVLLTLCSLGYFLKNLDQQNINNAFLSGMKEDLNMYGDELVTAVSIWTVGYVIGQIPVNLLLTRVRPKYVLPMLEIGWGVATLGSYAVHNAKALYACRFLVGLFESGFYPAAHLILGSWYTPRELGKRSVIFWLSGTIGQMFSGFLQSAAYTNLSGRHGLEGWRWLFIIDAIITLPIAVAGFFFLPNLPLQGGKVWWLTEDQHNLAIARVDNDGKRGKEVWTWGKVKRLASSWHLWVLPLEYVLWNNSIPQSPMGYWLKSFNSKATPVPGVRYTVSQINNLPLPGSAILIVSALALAWLSDGALNGRRFPVIYFCALIVILFAAILRQLPLYESIHGHYAVYWLMNAGTSSGPLILAWINEILASDLEKRALGVAMANDFAYVVQAVAPNFVWKTVDFPAARTGFTWSIILSVLLILWTTLILLLLRRDQSKPLQRSRDDNTVEPLSSPSSLSNVENKDYV